MGVFRRFDGLSDRLSVGQSARLNAPARLLRRRRINLNCCQLLAKQNKQAYIHQNHCSHHAYGYRLSRFKHRQCRRSSLRPPTESKKRNNRHTEKMHVSGADLESSTPRRAKRRGWSIDYHLNDRALRERTHL